MLSGSKAGYPRSSLRAPARVTADGFLFFFTRVPGSCVVNSLDVSRPDKLLDRILRGGSDANIPFDDLRRLLQRLGFEERIRASHHIFRKQGIEEKINLQRDGSKAKVYQVRQVRAIILKHSLGGED